MATFKGNNISPTGISTNCRSSYWLDSADLYHSFKDVRGEPSQPIVRLTPLGWTRVGNLGQIGIMLQLILLEHTLSPKKQK